VILVSTSVKAVRRTFIKLTPGVVIIHCCSCSTVEVSRNLLVLVQVSKAFFLSLLFLSFLHFTIVVVVVVFTVVSVVVLAVPLNF